MSESELAARAGVSQSYISRILTGEVTNPTIEFVVRLARALGITVSELIGETAAERSPAPRTKAEIIDDLEQRTNDLHSLINELRQSE